MPFGEEIGSGVGGRTTGMGYGAVDGIRKKFTGYERDSETGLDYAQARYFSSTQGRFTSPDPLMASGHAADPQSWNRYSYVQNNPLKFVDPSGMIMGQRKDGEVGSISVLDGTQYSRGTMYGFTEGDVAEYEAIAASMAEAKEWVDFMVPFLGNEAFRIRVYNNVAVEPGQQLLEAQQALRDKIVGALTGIDAAAEDGKLTQKEVKAIRSLKGITVRADYARAFTRDRYFIMPQDVVSVSSKDGLTASIIHDSYHAYQQRRFAMDIGEKAERKASCFTVPIAQRLGLNAQIIKDYQADCITGHAPVTNPKRRN